MNYSTPSLTVYGDSSVLIKGECGWGVENVWLDKTGYYEYWHLECSVTDARLNSGHRESRMRQ